MQLKTTLFAGLGLLGGIVRAGYDARSAEAIFFYYAYRMDVEVSSAAAAANGATSDDIDRDKPWMIGRGITSYNDPADWPDGVEDKSRRGLNFHAFIQGSQASGSSYGRKAARQKITNPWEPDLSAFADKKKGNKYVERNNIMRLPFDAAGAKLAEIDDETNELTSKGNKNSDRFSFTGFDPAKLFGDLNRHDGAHNTKANYFDFDNMLSIITRRCSYLYRQNPDLGKPYMEKLEHALTEAQRARSLETKKYSLKNIRGAWDEYQKKNFRGKDGTISGKYVKSDRMSVNQPDSMFHGWEFDDFNTRDTRIALKNNKALPQEHRSKLLDLAIDIGEAFWTGERPQRRAAGDFYGGFSNDDKTHAEVTKRQHLLNRSIRKQIDQNGNPDGCDWGTPKFPGNVPVPGWVQPPGHSTKKRWWARQRM